MTIVTNGCRRQLKCKMLFSHFILRKSRCHRMIFMYCKPSGYTRPRQIQKATLRNKRLGVLVCVNEKCFAADYTLTFADVMDLGTLKLAIERTDTSWGSFECVRAGQFADAPRHRNEDDSGNDIGRAGAEKFLRR